MGTLSLGHLLVLLIIIFVLFGAGKLPRVMGDIGRGIRHLREGLKGEDDAKKPTALPAASPEKDNTPSA